MVEGQFSDYEEELSKKVKSVRVRANLFYNFRVQHGANMHANFVVLKCLNF